jgi:peptidoglycan-associated lipoprotein
MMTTIRGGVLLWATLTFTLIAQAQQSAPHLSADIAVAYNAEMAKIATVDCGCFWLQGGSADVAVPLFRGLGAAAILTGSHSSSIAPGVDLSKIAFMAGPRYTLGTSRWTRRLPKLRHGTSIFGQALFGDAHGFDSAFPTSSGPKSSANSFSMQFGGGLNIGLARGFGLRAFELDYVRSSFRNLANNTQNDLRLAIGATYHIGER